MTSMQSVGPSERKVQLQYWVEHTPDQPTVETMMLDSQAKDIDCMERPEVLSLLGNVRGASVVELGAGIGRFTGELCRAGARAVLAVDFMAASIAENRRLHSKQFPAIQLSFLVEDATQLQLPTASTDVIFSNWLLMYLADAEVISLAGRMLEWLTPGGMLFFRESCHKQSGDKPRKDNPTHYRDPQQYTSWFESVSCSTPMSDQEDDASDGSVTRYRFQLEVSQPVATYIKVKGNQNQICWRWRKVAVSEQEIPSSPDAGSSHSSETV